MATILIIEDNENMRLLMEARLKNLYTIYLCENGKAALHFLEKKEVDMLLIDVMMPVMDGFEFLKQLRSLGNQTPAIMVTAKSKIDDKKIAFDLGIDDYLTKPIDFDELKFRIKAVLRRSKISSEKQIKIGSLTVDYDSFSLIKDDLTITLTQKEFLLLYKLLSYPNVIFTKEQLLNSIWGLDSESDEATIRTHTNRLREKTALFSEFELVTIRGIGYKAVIKEKS